MSSLKFLYFFEIIPVRKKVCCSCSLKLANQTFSLLVIALYCIALFFDIKYSAESIFLTLTKYFVSCILNVISSYYVFKSTRDLTYKDAYIGHLLLFWSFVTHVFLLFVNSIFNIQVFPVIWMLTEQFQVDTDDLFTKYLPQVIFILFEFYFLWICYRYTKNLSLGKDALVDGQNFDRYIEDFASSANSQKSSPRHSHNGLPLANFDKSFTLNQSQEHSMRDRLNLNHKV